MSAWDDQPPGEQELNAYMNFLDALKRDGVPIRGILLYGLARPSLQEESIHLSALDKEWMQITAERIRQTGFEVKLSV